MDAVTAEYDAVKDKHTTTQTALAPAEDRVTLSGLDIARRPLNAVCKAGRGPAESANPAAPKEFTEPSYISVYGLPVTKGVEEPKRPNFEEKISSGPRELCRGQTLVACEKKESDSLRP